MTKMASLIGNKLLMVREKSINVVAQFRNLRLEKQKA